ncbi:MAG: hypothetical protein HQL12_06055 [Candidatus Omnitrophica bacterium]|nr:hypothetical protein [Candidatus Omnitrophota bacterium]
MLKKHFLLLTLLASALFFFCSLHYQYILSQEDHGRDLYTFAQVSQGKHIYKDMWWEYGPLMPYYYALFDILFGLKISSVLLGKAILNIFGCLFFYLASCEIMSTPWAFLSACFFMLQQHDFFYTYNHIGGIALFLMLFWQILKYFRNGDQKNIFLALGSCLLIGFIKINFGISALAATFLSIIIIEIIHSRLNKKKQRTKPFYLIGLLIVPLLWGIVYCFILNGLTITEINQCLPYFGDNKPIISTPLQSIKGYWTQNYIFFLTDWLSFLESSILITQNPTQLLKPFVLLTCSIAVLKLFIYPLIFGSIISAFWISFTKKFKSRLLEFWLIQSVLWLFIVFNLHEYIVSNIWYRSFWSQPFLLFFCFFMISTAISFVPKFRFLAGGFFISLFILVTINVWIVTKNSCTPDKFLKATTGQIYVGNESGWVSTFNEVTDYLNKNLKKDELFFAMPCGSLFYYLTNKPSPSRQTIFFNLFHITPQQELSVIRELENKKVNYVLLSNRIKTKSPELGEFGKSYCRLIYQYVGKNFIPFYSYGGNWNIPAGWANNHGVILLKRKPGAS